MGLISVSAESWTYFDGSEPVSLPLDQGIVAGLSAAFAEHIHGSGVTPLRRSHHGASDNLRRRAGRPATDEGFSYRGPTSGFGKEVGKSAGLRADNPEDRSKIDAYMREAGIPQSSANIAWCAAWLNAQLAHEGVRGSGALSVSSFEHWGRSEKASEAKAGDVMIVNGGAHVGRFTGDIKNGRYGFYSGNAGESGEPAPRPGRSQWGGVKEQWLDPSGVEFRGLTDRQRYHNEAMKAADQSTPRPTPKAPDEPLPPPGISKTTGGWRARSPKPTPLPPPPSAGRNSMTLRDRPPIPSSADAWTALHKTLDAGNFGTEEGKTSRQWGSWSGAGPTPNDPYSEKMPGGQPWVPEDPRPWGYLHPENPNYQPTLDTDPDEDPDDRV